jgi:Putative Actinobacterial Holin-X, holin superfamily III
MNTAPDGRSISQLVGDALSELGKLVQNEIDLARAELREKVEIASNAFKFIAVGTVLLIPSLVLVLFAIASALIHFGAAPWLAYLCTGLGAAIIACALIWIGVGRLSGDALKPSATLGEFRRDKIVAKEFTR